MVQARTRRRFELRDLGAYPAMVDGGAQATAGPTHVRVAKQLLAAAGLFLEELAAAHDGEGASRLAKGRVGYSGRYLRVRKRASEKGLSSLACGRLKEVSMPRRSRVASIVEPFIGPPLSE